MVCSNMGPHIRSLSAALPYWIISKKYDYLVRDPFSAWPDLCGLLFEARDRWTSLPVVTLVLEDSFELGSTMKKSLGTKKMLL
jgi:hypothetical protein